MKGSDTFLLPDVSFFLFSYKFIFIFFLMSLFSCFLIALK
nr:MAG TPA: hypothetical protein [Caudoviricetes sp.]